MYLPMIATASLLALLTATPGNAQTLEDQFNDCLRKASGDCPTIEEVIEEKRQEVEEVMPAIVEPQGCVERPYAERDFLFECTQEVTPWDTLNHGPGHDDDIATPHGKKEYGKRSKKGKKGYGKGRNKQRSDRNRSSNRLSHAS